MTGAYTTGQKTGEVTAELRAYCIDNEEYVLATEDGGLDTLMEMNAFIRKSATIPLASAMGMYIKAKREGTFFRRMI